MLFNSAEFAIFFPVVTLIYFWLPHKWRWLWLLLASCYFYAAFVPAYLSILALTIGVDYLAGLWIERSVGRQRKLALTLSLIVNIGILFVFKYLNFFAHTFQLPITLQLILPVGLSFHTFQSMSYTIEVYRKRQTAERHFGIFALYVMFYPQLVAGPIERPQNLLGQFRTQHVFDIDQARSGIELMIWGFFKKVVVADRLALLVSPVYDAPLNVYFGPTLITATMLFAIQIYCDFSGYSDIARGAARVMGFDLMENFRLPYFAKSISEFWSRWHISLSTWFRDYLYIPLGGNRVSLWRHQFNIAVVFLVSGLWHGASWNFVIWGALHAIFMILSALGGRVFRTPRYVLWTALSWAGTFALVWFAWIFFRASDLTHASYIATHLTTGVLTAIKARSLDVFMAAQNRYPGLPSEHVIAALVVFILLIAELLSANKKQWERFFCRKKFMRRIAYLTLITLILGFGVFDNSIPFVYFQF